MSSVRLWIAGIFCVVFTSGPFLVADAASRSELSAVRCVVVDLRMVDMPLPRQRVAGTMLAVYYLGRLDGYTSHADLDALIEREARRMNAVEFRANAARCGKALSAKGQEIAKIGTDHSRTPSR